MKIENWTSRSRLSPREGRVIREDPMVKNSPHKRYKGCCWICGKSKMKTGGKWGSTPAKYLRKLGVDRRYRKSRPYGETD